MDLLLGFLFCSIDLCSTGFLSSPLALFMVMLPKAHLTSHSRMSGSRWVITPLWLHESWRSFLYSSSVYSCHLLISSASVKSIPFLSFIVPIFASNVLLVSPVFLKRSLSGPKSVLGALTVLATRWWKSHGTAFCWDWKPSSTLKASEKFFFLRRLDSR